MSFLNEIHDDFGYHITMLVFDEDTLMLSGEVIVEGAPWSVPAFKVRKNNNASDRQKILMLRALEMAMDDYVIQQRQGENNDC